MCVYVCDVYVCVWCVEGTKESRTYPAVLLAREYKFARI